jgi:aminoglycoside phosphotransferase (APT) family kinase protein
MADTASRRSEPAEGADARRSALVRFLAEASGADCCEIADLSPLAGGAIQENWGLDARFAGGRLDGVQRLVLRAAGDTGVPSSLDRLQEFAILRAAFAAGVKVPEPLCAAADPAIFGKPFFVMRWAPGIAAAHRITRDAALDPVLPELAERLGRELARIHRIRPPRPDLGFLAPHEMSSPAHQLAGFRDYLDRHPAPRPVLEWAIRWLETHIPPLAQPVLCHHDFRTGNYLVDGGNLSAILDWEFAGWGDAHEDIGWFCSKAWRFARLDREAGGIAGREPFYHGYESESGRRIDPVRVHFWEVLASVRWAVIALQQSDRHITGGERSLDLALTGRRAGECELELLLLLDPDGAPGGCSDTHGPDAPAGLAPQPTLTDRPVGPALLALARTVLIEDLLPLLPPERRLEARLIANCMAIAEREARADDATFATLCDDLQALYRLGGPSPSSPDLIRGSAGPSLSPHGGERAGVRGDPSSAQAREHLALWSRFARDLRIGAFENSPQCQARVRAILWQMTIARLRLANPRFLAANGFA